MRSFDAFYFHLVKQPLLILKGIGNNNTGLNNLLNSVRTFIIKVLISAIISQYAADSHSLILKGDLA
jgi:hypothetical protein